MCWPLEQVWKEMCAKDIEVNGRIRQNVTLIAEDGSCQSDQISLFDKSSSYKKTRILDIWGLVKHCVRQ